METFNRILNILVVAALLIAGGAALGIPTATKWVSEPTFVVLAAVALAVVVYRGAFGLVRMSDDDDPNDWFV